MWSTWPRDKKKSAKVFFSKALIENITFTSPNENAGPPFHVVIRATRRSSCLQSKTRTLILSYFKTLSIGPTRGSKPRPSTLQSRLALAQYQRSWSRDKNEESEKREVRQDLKSTNRKARQKNRGLKEHYTHILRRWPTFEYL